MYIKVNNKKINIKVCKNFKTRLIGLMFKRNIKESLCFPKCNSIHTFFMFNTIDVYMTDKNYKVINTYKNLKPFRIILPKKNVYYVFEFKVNTVNFQINETIKITY